MSKLIKGILSAPSGNIGTVNGLSWKGKEVIRSRAKTRNQANTQKQLNTRSSLFYLTQFVQRDEDNIIETIWGSYKRGLTGANIFQILNLRAFQPNGIIDINKITWSKGDIPGKPLTRIELDLSFPSLIMRWQGTLPILGQRIYCSVFNYRNRLLVTSSRLIAVPAGGFRVNYTGDQFKVGDNVVGFMTSYDENTKRFGRPVKPINDVLV